MLSIENKAILDGLSFKQVARLWRMTGHRGDYMKKGGIDILRANIADYYSPATSDTAFPNDIAACFPDGIYQKGAKRSYRRHSIHTSNVSEPIVSAPVASTVPVSVTTDDESAQVLSQLQKLLTRPAPIAGVTEDRVLELINSHKAEVPTYRVSVTLPNKPEITTKNAPRHSAFPEVLSAIAAGLNVLLVGPAGAGKTHLCEQVAEALDMPFSFTGAVPSEYKLLGFVDAQGRTVRTQYRNAYENGGLFLWDEMDGSSPNAMLAFNAGLANGHQDFPDMVVSRNKDFRAIASANTYGNGADRQYVGRNQLDAASLDRFYVIPMDYDERLERVLYGDDEWTGYVHSVRKAVKSLNLRHVVSMRAIDQGQKALAAGVNRESVERAVLWKSLGSADISKIKGAM